MGKSDEIVCEFVSEDSFIALRNGIRGRELGGRELGGRELGSALKNRFRCKTPPCVVLRELWKTFSQHLPYSASLEVGDISDPHRNRHFSELRGFAAESIFKGDPNRSPHFRHRILVKYVEDGCFGLNEFYLEQSVAYFSSCTALYSQEYFKEIM